MTNVLIVDYGTAKALMSQSIEINEALELVALSATRNT